MTRTFNERMRCPKCGHEHTVETDFERWMRNSRDLDSRKAGIVRFDLDILLHKYLTLEDGKSTREIQCMMFVEVKTFMATPSPAQVDTLSMLNQTMRNRKINIHKTPRPQSIGAPRKVKSKLLNREVTLKMFGGHLLQLDSSAPDNSSLILWDYKEIDLQQLFELLRFERDPDSPNIKLDHRRRSRPFSKLPKLFDC